MNDTRTINGLGDGVSVPNPRWYGYDWPEVQRHYDRGAVLWRKDKDSGREEVSLSREKKRVEDDIHHTKALALVNGSSSPDAIKALEKRAAANARKLEKVREDRDVLRAAQRKHASDVEAAERKNAPQCVAAIDADDASDAARIAELEAEIQARKASMSGRASLRGRFSGVPSGPLVAA